MPWLPWLGDGLVPWLGGGLLLRPDSFCQQICGSCGSIEASAELASWLQGLGCLPHDLPHPPLPQAGLYLQPGDDGVTK